MNKLILYCIVSLAINVGIAQAADFAIVASSNKGGTLEPRGTTQVAQNASQSYTATASTDHYLADLKVDGVSVSLTDRTIASYPFNNVTAKHKIAAKFAWNPAITAKTNKGGVVAPPGKTLVAYGGSQSYSITPDEGYHLKSVSVDGVAHDLVSSHEFTDVTGKHTLAAKFAINTYAVSTVPGANGTIKPASATVNHNGNKTFTITPATGYQIQSVTVNGTPQEGIPGKGSYKLALKSVTEDTEIGATFSIQEAVKVNGLAVGSHVSVVDVKQATANASSASAGYKVARIRQAFALAAPPADSAYNTDKTHIYVQEKAGEAFNTVNMILCMIAQTKYSDSLLVNQGFYKAMIDSDSCQGNDSADNASSSAQSAGTSTEARTYDTWIANSERSSETSKHVLSAYVHLGKSGPNNQPMTIHAKVEVTQAATDANPLGLFSMNYKGVSDVDPSKIMMKGMLKTEQSNGKVVIRFAEQEGPNTSPVHVSKAAYSKNDVSETGQGSAYQLENFGPQRNEAAFNFAYDPDYFKRVDPVSEQGSCLDRRKFETSAWRYGLYDAISGDRANLEGGFPINTESDGSGTDGYLSYYGLNLPPNAPALNDGDPIYRGLWENGVHTSIPYSIVIKQGKLKRHTRSIITLDDIKNIPLEGGIPTAGNMSPPNTMYRVSWDGSVLAIRASAEMSQNGPPAWVDASPVTVIDDTYVFPFTNLGLYSQALGGLVNIQLQNCTPVDVNNPQAGFHCATPTATVPVVFYKESMVLPADVIPSTLACYENCPTAGANGMDGSSQQTMTYPSNFDPAIDSHHDYTFIDMLLNDSGTGHDVVLNTTPPGQPWGFNSGPLFELSQQNQEKLACDWDSSKTCGWKARNALDEFFTWETGPNSWNKFTAVKDANGGIVAFDPPWQVAFTYPSAGSNGVNSAEIDSKYSGSKFFLQYNGFGNLHGIPGKCVNPADPSQVLNDCSQPGLRWVPEFTIPSGSVVTANASEYLVKPLDMEQRMSKAENGCTGLTPEDMSNQWPNINTGWVNPNLPDEPIINEPPKVIGGVLQ